MRLTRAMSRAALPVARSMYAAMSAVQMMEPRMDVGLNPANNRSVQDALAAGAAPPQPSLEETLSLCEGLLVRSVKPGCHCPELVTSRLPARR